MSTSAYTHTYTVADIRRVLDCFAADLAMFAQSTGLRSRENVANVVGDLKAFAEAEYLQQVDVILWNGAGGKLKAAQYKVSTTAVGWATDLPKNSLWPNTPGGSLQLIVTLADSWWKLTDWERQRLMREWGLSLTWHPTHVDTSHTDMVRSLDRRYASNGYGIEKAIFQ